jgi:hypothetical protein
MNLLGAHLADLLSTDRRWRDWLLFFSETDRANLIHRPDDTPRAIELRAATRWNRHASDSLPAHAISISLPETSMSESGAGRSTSGTGRRLRSNRPQWVSRKKVSDPSRPIELVIQITQGRSDESIRLWHDGKQDDLARPSTHCSAC